MESEQRMKLIEDIRKELCHGKHHLDAEGEPFSGMADQIGNSLWNDGWRPEAAESVIFRRLHGATEAAWTQLWSLEFTLAARAAMVGHEHPAWLGLQEAHELVKERFEKVDAAREHWDAKYTEALAREGYND